MGMCSIRFVFSFVSVNFFCIYAYTYTHTHTHVHTDVNLHPHPRTVHAWWCEIIRLWESTYDELGTSVLWSVRVYVAENTHAYTCTKLTNSKLLLWLLLCLWLFQLNNYGDHEWVSQPCKNVSNIRCATILCVAQVLLFFLCFYFTFSSLILF